VLAALPLLPSSAKAATVAATAASGSAAKASAGGGKLGALLMNGMMALVSLLGASGIAGRWVGRKMRQASGQSSKGQQRVLQFWCALAIGFTVLVLPTMLVPSMKLPHHRLYHAASWSLVAFYGLVAAALAVWMWQRWRDARCPDTEPPATTELSIKSYRKWVVLGMLGPALILVKFVGGSLTSSTTTMRYSQIPLADALKIISEHKGGSDAAYFWRADADAAKIVSERNNARFMVNQHSDGSKLLVIRQPASAGPILYTPWDDSLIAALAEKGIAYKTQLAGGAPLKGDVVFRYGGFWNALNDQGSRFLRIFRWGIHHGDLRQWLVLLSTAIVAAASVLCLRRPGSPPVCERHP
jgi:hypothetical protein